MLRCRRLLLEGARTVWQVCVRRNAVLPGRYSLGQRTQSNDRSAFEIIVTNDTSVACFTLGTEARTFRPLACTLPRSPSDMMSNIIIITIIIRKIPSLSHSLLK
jgi:hypothetical protein